ncbi:hormone-sensitive lipase isoform X1 [Camelus dromedarius]|uniref:hormone-sensitive lipase isoform X1 n=1 Tax=Camelus dromedarius TaxID=9838 RepID=UPI0031197472
MEPGSRSVSRPSWEPEPHQTPITQPKSGPEKTPTAQTASEAQQRPSTQEEPASQQGPITQQEPLAQHEAEAQQEPQDQQKSNLQHEFLAPQEPAAEQSPPTQRVPFTKQEAASQHRPRQGKEPRTQQEPELREEPGTQPGHGLKNELPGQTEPMSQQRWQQSDPTAQHIAPAQGAKSPKGSLAQWHFLSKPKEPFIQQMASEQKTLLEWVTDSGTESDLRSSLETDSSAKRDGTVAQGMKLAFRGKPGYEVMSGFGGMPVPRKKTSSQNPRHYRNTASRLIHSMDLRTMTQSLVTLAEDNMAFFSSQGPGETARRLSGVFAGVREQALGLEPALGRLLSVAHLFDLDAETPANGYRSLVHTARCCLAHLLHKSRYVASNRRSIFFRASHNLAELEAYLAALTQLRALAYYAQHLLATNRPGRLFFEGDEGVTADFLREYVTLHKGCFYGRCLGFQFTPAIRPFLQTISIGLVSFGEHYKRNETGLGVTASSLFTSGRFAIDPELRGAEFERIIQNLDVHFWKAFWNITEIEVLSSLANMASATVRVSRLLSLPPKAFEMPLTADPKLMVTISPPLAHTGPGPVLVRLISYDLREGQDSEELSSLVRSEGPRSLELRPRPQQAPRSRSLVVHIHGGGFVAQTSKSHEPYLKSWAQELGTPILSIDYSLAPEAPFPRALEECFYAYCWAVKHCALLGSTGERICLAGDSAGGNLCFTVSLRAAAYGVRVPDGIMAAYPATMLQSTASPSRLLSLMDPLLPLSVLSKCVSAYAGGETEDHSDSDQKALGMMGLVRRDTALLFRDLRLGASSWLNSFLELSGHKSHPNSVPVAEPMRRSVSEAALAQPEGLLGTDSLKSLTLHDLSLRGSSETADTPELSLSAETLGPSTPSAVNFLLGPEDAPEEAEARDEPRELSTKDRVCSVGSAFPEGFHPRRSSQGSIRMPLYSSPIVKNPFMSPLLAPDSMLQTLPPVHIVACALDPMLDDSVMFARRLRSLGQPVTLHVVEDLPHGFLSLAALCRETRQAAAVCVERIRLVLNPPGPSAPTTPLV